MDYGKLVKIFKSHLVQPKWHKDMHWDADFSHLEYLIRGHPERKASNPSFAHRILNGVLSQCSNLMLEKRNETAS